MWLIRHVFFLFDGVMAWDVDILGYPGIDGALGLQEYFSVSTTLSLLP